MSYLNVQLEQRAHLAQLSCMPPATDAASRHRFEFEKFVLQQSEWLLSKIISNCTVHTENLDLFATASGNVGNTSRNWQELTLAWLREEDSRTQKNACSILSSHLAAKNSNSRRILKAWLSTILDSMSLLMPILTEQRTKIELKIEAEK